MTPTGSELLTRLGSAPSPARVGGSPIGTDVASAGFAELLRGAQTGGVHSGLEVRLGSGLESDTFTPEQMERLAHAADKAQAAGIANAVVLMDGRAWELDVTGRTIVGPAQIPEHGVLEGVDAVIDAGGGGAEAFERPERSATSVGLEALHAAGELVRTLTNPAA